MSADKLARRELDLNTLRLPPDIPVVRIEVEDYVNWDGEPSLRVLVVLDEKADADKMSGAAVSDLKDQIRDKLHADGSNGFAYIFLAKASELADVEG